MSSPYMTSNQNTTQRARTARLVSVEPCSQGHQHPTVCVCGGGGGGGGGVNACTCVTASKDLKHKKDMKDGQPLL